MRLINILAISISVVALIAGVIYNSDVWIEAMTPLINSSVFHDDVEILLRIDAFQGCEMGCAKGYALSRTEVLLMYVLALMVLLVASKAWIQFIFSLAQFSSSVLSLKFLRRFMILAYTFPAIPRRTFNYVPETRMYQTCFVIYHLVYLSLAFEFASWRGFLLLLTPYITLMPLFTHFRILGWIDGDVETITQLITKYGENLHLDVRSVMRNADLSSFQQQRNHSHPKSAGLRAAAEKVVDEVALKMGCDVYDVSESTRNRLAGNSGSRLHYFQKDLIMDYKNDEYKDSSLIKMIDVDYHVNMNNYLRGNPLMLYTFAPDQSAGATSFGEALYYFEDDRVHLKVNGGATYTHALWDYDLDHVYVRQYLGWYPWNWYGVLYLVESKLTPDPHRRLVSFTPVKRVPWPICLWHPEKKLQRRKVTHGGFNLVSRIVQRAEVTSQMVSISKTGSTVADDIPLSAIETAYFSCIRASKLPSTGSVQAVFKKAGVPDHAHAAANFLSVFSNVPHILTQNLPSLAKCIPAGTTHYNAAGPYVLDDGKALMREVCSPLRMGSTCPKSSINNSKNMVNGRVRGQRNLVTDLPPEWKQYLKEFASKCIPDHLVHTGIPTDEDSVCIVQNRPSQMAIFEQYRATAAVKKFVVSVFQKAEAYAKLAFPRAISTTPPKHKIRLSLYTYPLADVFKKFKWYAFGRTPKELSEYIHKRVKECNVVKVSDFDNFDGSQQIHHSEVIEVIGTRFFSPEYHREFRKYVREERDAPAFSEHGNKYDTGCITLSGSPLTSMKNTAINAFETFKYYRTMGYTVDEAWKKLGIYGGDDGMNFDILDDKLEKIHAASGLSSRSESFIPGDAVPFLGRLYCDPWSDDTSIADVKRQITKIHLTHAPQTVPDHIVLLRKAESTLVTDPDTPLLSEWARMMMEILKAQTAPTDQKRYQQYINSKEDISWWAQYKDSPFPVPERSKANEVVAKQLDISEAELEELCALLESCTCLEDMEGFCPMFEEEPPVVKLQAVTDDGLLEPPETTVDTIFNQILEEERKRKPDGSIMLKYIAQAKAVLPLTWSEDLCKYRAAHPVTGDIKSVAAAPTVVAAPKEKQKSGPGKIRLVKREEEFNLPMDEPEADLPPSVGASRRTSPTRKSKRQRRKLAKEKKKIETTTSSTVQPHIPMRAAVADEVVYRSPYVPELHELEAMSSGTVSPGAVPTVRAGDQGVDSLAVSLSAVVSTLSNGLSRGDKGKKKVENLVKWRNSCSLPPSVKTTPRISPVTTPASSAPPTPSGGSTPQSSTPARKQSPARATAWDPSVHGLVRPIDLETTAGQQHYAQAKKRLAKQKPRGRTGNPAPRRDHSSPKQKGNKGKKQSNPRPKRKNQGKGGVPPPKLD